MAHAAGSLLLSCNSAFGASCLPYDQFSVFLYASACLVGKALGDIVPSVRVYTFAERKRRRRFKSTIYHVQYLNISGMIKFKIMEKVHIVVRVHIPDTVAITLPLSISIVELLLGSGV